MKTPDHKTDLKRFAKTVKPHSLYKVRVAFFENNPIFNAYLFTSFGKYYHFRIVDKHGDTIIDDMLGTPGKPYFIEIVKKLDTCAD